MVVYPARASKEKIGKETLQRQERDLPASSRRLPGEPTTRSSLTGLIVFSTAVVVSQIISTRLTLGVCVSHPVYCRVDHPKFPVCVALDRGKQTDHMLVNLCNTGRF